MLAVRVRVSHLVLRRTVCHMCASLETSLHNPLRHTSEIERGGYRQAALIGRDWWLARWSSQSGAEQQANKMQDIAMYAALSFVGGSMVLWRTCIVSRSGLKASRSLFSDMLRSVCRSVQPSTLSRLL